MLESINLNRRYVNEKMHTIFLKDFKMNIYSSIFVLFCISFFLGMFFCSCSLINKPYTRELGFINDKTCNDLKRKYDMDCSGMGLGLDGSNERIATIYIRFNIKKIATIEEARIIAIDALNIMYKNITDNKNFTTNYAEEGFNESIIDIAIFFRGPQNEKLFDPYIGVVSIGNNIVSFLTNDPENKYRYKTDIQESLEEARLKVLE